MVEYENFGDFSFTVSVALPFSPINIVSLYSTDSIYVAKNSQTFKTKVFLIFKILEECEFEKHLHFYFFRY